VTAPPVLVEVERSGLVESVHRGHAVVVDASGAVIRAWGEPGTVIYPRSAVKPLQAVGMVEAGLALTGSDLALACASHSGEPFHLEGVRAVLAAGGLAETDLQCPPDLPYAAEARAQYLAAGSVPARVAMNCSGKHAAMLRTCVQRDWSVRDYLDPQHPLQRRIRAVIEDLAGTAVAHSSTDGCGAPLWALPLVALGLIQVLALPPAQASMLMAFAALPTASSAYVLAVRMGGNGPFVAGLITLSTLLGMVSLPVWLVVQGWVGR